MFYSTTYSSPLGLITLANDGENIVDAGGGLTGYAGGISKKVKLLQLEGVDTSKFSTNSKSTAL